MPKNTNAHGPTYDGHVDTSPEDRSQPEWVPAEQLEPPVDPEPEPVKRGPGRPKGSKNKTTASAGAAEGKGGARGE